MRASGALSLLVLLLAPGAALARGYETLGTLEKQAVDDALGARGLALEPAPDGKVIGAVHVVTLEVFSPRDGFFQLLNIFHRTTREHVFRREALFRPGDRYDQEVVDETMRNLQSPVLSSVVVVLPVKSARPGQVDVLIVTRDVWSLRLNTDFEYQQGKLIYLSTSLSENNILGFRKLVAAAFSMDQGRMAAGPSYVDPNIAGSRLRLHASARALFGRESGRHEGSTAGLEVDYPLYALARRWGGSIGFGHSDAVVRRFLGTELRRVFPRGDAADPRVWLSDDGGPGCWGRREGAAPPGLAPEETAPLCLAQGLPWIYRLRSFVAQAGVVRSFRGRRVIQRVSAGPWYGVVRPGFVGGFPDDPALREAFAAAVFPRSERIASLWTRYVLFTPRYRVYRDFRTFDLREDVQLGPSLDLGASRVARAFGAERDFWRLAASAAWTFDLGDGFQNVGASWSGRLEGGRLIDQQVSGRLYGATPLLARAVRVLAEAATTVLLDDTENRFFTLGGESGLRGYTIGDFIGRTHMIGHLEARTVALKVASFRLGGLVFYDVGHVTDSPPPGGGLDRLRRALAGLDPHHDVGFGLRLLIPQLEADVMRFDWAFATRTTRFSRAGWPGRISIGFRQAF